MEAQDSRKRRRYSRELKAQILAECAAPGASVAKVALGHGINANIVHGWRKLARQAQVPTALSSQFVPVTVASAPPVQVEQHGIEVEVRRGAATIRLTWPRDAANELATWMRELLR
jgi:transposase